MKSLLQNLTSELRADLLSAKAVPALAAGFTSGLGLLVAQVAFGSFIFSGPLASYSSQGVGLVLFGNFATCLIIALAGGYLGAIAGLSPALVIVMATVGFTMDAEGDALFATTAVALIISAVATGACCLLIGRFRLANLVRFIPYPVTGGFLQTAHTAGVRVVLSTLSKELQTGLEHNLPPAVYAELLVEPDADRALERCEDIVIAEWRDMADERRASLLEHTVDDLERYLERQIDFENLLEELRPWLSPHQYAADEDLIGPDAPPEGLQLLLAGRASGYDAAGTRLYQCGPGDAIWPAGAAEQRATSVVADEPCRTMVLTPVARGNLEENEQRLTLKLYRYLLAGCFQAESGAEQ